MASVYNDQISLVDLLEFNRQIEGMLAAGIPLSWQGDDSSAVLRSESERVTSRVAILVGQGSPFLEAWKAIPDVSLPYQAAFFGWVFSCRSPSAFDLLKLNTTRLPQARRLWFLNFQLGVVFFLALGVLAIWLTFGRMSLVYNDSKLAVGPLSRFLESMQDQPVFAMAGCVVALILWGIVLHFSKIRISKLSQAITTTEIQAHRNWIKSQFMELVMAHSGNVGWAEQLFESLVRSERSPQPTNASSKEGDYKPSDASDSASESTSWLTPQGYILWSSEKAVERKISYRVSTLPYTIYFVGSGVVVLSIGLLVFGPLIELLYAAVVPGAF
ncbi:MAG: hypothetical protein ACK5YR_23980 [Pirellula sp.]|jgi:hypothetical protein